MIATDHCRVLSRDALYAGNATLLGAIVSARLGSKEGRTLTQIKRQSTW
jgi:hypothetical protein